mgnify:CR=1 FL=1
MELLAVNSSMRWYAIQISSLALNFGGFIWLYLCAAYTNRNLFSNRPTAFFLILPSIICEILCITNRHHHLFFASDELLTAGAAGLSLVFIGSLYVFIALGYLFQYAARQNNISHKRSTYIFVLFVLIPFIFETLYVIDVTFISHTLRLRFFPCFSLSFSSIIIVYIIFRYRFLDLLPMAYKDIINNLSEAIIVVDREGKVIQFNKAFRQNFPIYPKHKNGRDFDVLIRYLREQARSFPENSWFFEALKNPGEREFSTELLLQTGQCFLVTVKPIIAFHAELAGRIISLANITEYKKLKEAEFDVIKERNRIARDVHDTLGHKMTLLLYLLEVIDINYEKKPDLVKDNIQKAIQTVGEGYEELRRSIYGLTFKELKMNHLIKALREIFAGYTAAGMEIDFSIEGKSECYDERYSHTICRICQEALTNSFKHGKAQKVSIILQFIQSKIKLYIFDNGRGCKDIKTGVGLYSMGQRIKDLNGSFILGSNDDGFYINVELP